MDNYRLIPTVRATDKRNARVPTVEKVSGRVRNPITLTPDELMAFLRYETPIMNESDPLRPMGYFDSWAGNIKEKQG